ncbi:hypothetical protein [Micromonospora sp. NPDC004704]
MTGQSRLGELCDAVRYIGDGTGTLAAALDDQSRKLTQLAARMQINAVGDRMAAQSVAAAFDAAARACGRAASLLLDSGRQARGYASANCGGGGGTALLGRGAVAAAVRDDRRMSGRQAALDRIEYIGFSNPVTHGAYKGLADFPVQVLSEIDSVRYTPATRTREEVAGRSHCPDDPPGAPATIWLYGSSGRDRPADPTDDGERQVLADVLIHEVGHVMYHRALSASGRDAWEELCRTAYATGEPPVSAYGATSFGEDFAEAVLAMYRKPGWLHENARTRYRFVEALFEKLESEELSGHR